MYREETVEVRGTPMPVLLFTPEGDGPHPGLVVAQHLPIAHTGITNDPFQIEVGERCARAGYACAIPWLFHWWPADADIDVKRTEFRDDQTVDDLQAGFDLLAAQSDVDGERIGILGHCWGGRVAWLGACHDARYRVCVVFYGGRIKAPFADGAPAPITLAGNMRCAVLGHFGNEDQSPSPADVNDYETALRDAAVDCAFHRYDGAGHGFQDFNNPQRYRETQSEQAWATTLAFLSERL